MTWFKVDDTFHAHPKVLATDPAALGLWVVAGAWSSAHLTEGFVPDHALPRLLPDSEPLARKLVSAGLWRRVRGGHQFHDWTDYNPAASAVREMREKRAAAGRKGGLASGKTRSKQGSKREALASSIVEPPTRPFPSKEGKTGSARGAPRSVARATPAATHPPSSDDPGNPDWRTMPAYGQAEPRPETPAQIAARRAAAAAKPTRTTRDGPSALERLLAIPTDPQETP